MNYQEAIVWLNEQNRFVKTPTLAPMQGLLARLGHPDNEFATIHIAGTNGKGSTASFTARLAMSHGLKTGLYTSPHLVRYEERIVVSGQPISEGDFVRLLTQVQKEMQDVHPVFDVLTAMALLYFAEQQCEVVVLEAGLGGMYDATNAISSPTVSVITSIGFDHMERLGHTLSLIAVQKAGIIRQKTPVVLGELRSEADSVIKEVATIRHAPLYCPVPEQVASSRTGTTFVLDKRSWQIPLLGQHQAQNAAMAIEAFSLCAKALGYQVSQQKLQSGLLATTWPGRLEILQREPFLILDGAHNEEGIGALVQSIRDLQLAPLVLVFAMLKEKEPDAILGPLLPFAKRLILTNIANPRVLSPLNLIQWAGIGEIIQEPFFAVQSALGRAQPGETVLVAGSLYLIGEVRKAWSER